MTTQKYLIGLDDLLKVAQDSIVYVEVPAPRSKAYWESDTDSYRVIDADKFMDGLQQLKENSDE